MRKLYLLLPTVLMVLLTTQSGHARPIAALEGFEALRKVFSGINDFSAEITQEKRLSIMKRTLVTQGTVRFRSPDLFMLEIRPPYTSRLLLRDNVIEQAGAREGDRSRIVLAPEQSLRHWFAKLSQPAGSLPEGAGVRADLSGSTYTLSIAPRGQGQVREVTIVFQADGTIRRLVIDERNGDRASMTFWKMRRNTGLNEKDFRLE